MSAEFLYFADPMCSWCYAFGPVAAQLSTDYSERATLTVIPGGLRPDETRPTPERMAREIVGHWRHVEEASALPFDFDFFVKSPGFVYDTAPACRALTAVGRIKRSLALPFKSALQRRFYAGAQDPRSEETFVAAAAEVGIEGEFFLEVYRAAETETMMRELFEFARNLGIHGFPTLVLRFPEKLALLTRGYLPYAELQPRIEQAFAKFGPATGDSVPAGAPE